MKKKDTVKMSFLTKRKNINDLFFDLVNERTKIKPLRFKNGKIKKGQFKREGITKFAKELKVTPKQITNYIKKGKVNENLYHLTRNIEIQHKKSKLSKTKKTTKQFTVHTFTFNNFFHRKYFKVNPNKERLYFQAGLYIYFERKKRISTGADLNERERVNMEYTIQNLPVSHYSKNYPEGYREFFDIIKLTLDSYPSIKYFRFNYFNVKKINLEKIN